MLALSLIPIAAIVISFCTKYDNLKEPCKFLYAYNANTTSHNLDHSFLFSLEKVDSGYRCYIERIPSFRGRDTSNYQYHTLREKSSNRLYVCWTGNIKYIEQAKTLCRNWADATQKFIDTGIPAPGFGGYV